MNTGKWDLGKNWAGKWDLYPPFRTLQIGYVSGRYIGEAARSILNVMEYTKTVNIPVILLFIDFEKAFDSLEWNFMFKCLEAFGFGHSLIRWVETFYSNISSCIINNGTFSANFELGRGVRQGDPLSPYLFAVYLQSQLRF